jgi:YfiH family protein
VNVPATFLLRPFPEWGERIAAAFTTRGIAAAPSGPYDRLNLGFRSGDGPARVAANWREALAAADLAGRPLALPRMVHGDALADIDALPDRPPPAAEGTPSWEPEGADAVCASAPGRVLAVTTADCLAALVFDPSTGTITAVHAGWRGTRARILAKTLSALAAAGRIRPERTLVAFGPCLRAESLAVGPDVAAQLDPRFLINREGRACFDMPADNRAQALDAGVPEANIRDLGGDTLREPERYFSYRRDGSASGRLAAFISVR